MRFDVSVAYSGGANTVFSAGFVENRSTISVIAATIDEPNRKTTGTGRRPVLAITN
jgi:hypothetical protein